MIGVTFGPYQVQGILGVGGMGEVYRAYDEALCRYVAVKVLPPKTATDRAAIDRLKTEARTLASLNHPNIAAVFGLEEVNGRTIIVMELVEGASLSSRIRSGKIPLADALTIARQIADALEAAHAIGVVHRDIKPSNIKFAADGRIKVLDFGIARLEATPTAFDGDTTSEDVTRLAGTPSYMSPEQARGQAADARSDIWSFGCVVYELITGRRAFAGDTASDVFAAVLKQDPRWQDLPAETPEAIHRLLRRCLERDASRRLRHIADARLEIDEALEPPAVPLPVRRRPWKTVALLATALAVAGAGGWLATRSRDGAFSGVSPRFGIELEDAVPLDAMRQPSLALSPDGWTLVYVATQGGQRHLRSRTLGRFDSSPLVGTEGAEGPFFAPDGEWVGFAAAGKLKKISLRNGSIVTICDAPDPRGATWGDDNVITFAAGPFTGLSRVSADGGTPIELTRLSGDESTHRWPQAAPGGKQIVFTIGFRNAPSFDEADVALSQVDGGDTKRLLKGTFARYVNTGHLVYVRGGSLMAVPVDRSLAPSGPPAVALEGVGARPFSGTGWYAVGDAGTLVYASALGSTDNSVVWVDQAGRVTPAIPFQKAYATPRLAPDQSRLIVTIYAPDGTPDLWSYELERGSMTRLTVDGLNTGPSWSPDGKLIAFTSRRAGDPFFVPWVMSPSGGEARRLRVGPFPTWVTSWAPDGQRLAVSQLRPNTGLDIVIARLDGVTEPEPFLQTRFNETSGTFSPNGRWMAYASDESGRSEVYLRDIRQREQRWPVSVDGGSEPMWSRDGTSLYFRRGAQLLRATVAAGPNDEPRIGQPVQLFEGPYQQDTSSGEANFDVGNGETRFLMIQNGESARTHHMTVVFNWFDELRRRFP